MNIIRPYTICLRYKVYIIITDSNPNLILLHLLNPTTSTKSPLNGFDDNNRVKHVPFTKAALYGFCRAFQRLKCWYLIGGAAVHMVHFNFPKLSSNIVFNSIF